MSAASPGWMHEVLGLTPSTTACHLSTGKEVRKSGSSGPWTRRAAQLVDCLPNPEFTPTTCIRCVPVNSSALYSWRQEDPQLHSKLRPAWARRAPLSGAEGEQRRNKTLSREHNWKFTWNHCTENKKGTPCTAVTQEWLQTQWSNLGLQVYSSYQLNVDNVNNDLVWGRLVIKIWGIYESGSYHPQFSLWWGYCCRCKVSRITHHGVWAATNDLQKSSLFRCVICEIDTNCLLFQKCPNSWKVTFAMEEQWWLHERNIGNVKKLMVMYAVLCYAVRNSCLS